MDSPRVGSGVPSLISDLQALRRGETCTYHCGFLALDRSQKPEVMHTAQEALRLYKNGAVTLVQRLIIKTGIRKYEYIAIGLR